MNPPKISPLKIQIEINQSLEKFNPITLQLLHCLAIGTINKKKINNLQVISSISEIYEINLISLRHTNCCVRKFLLNLDNL